jgi:hypothetical protein
VPRAKALSVFSPYLHQGDFWGLFWRSILGNFGLFGFRGDPNWLYNIPGRPQLDAVQAVLFWLGLALCLIRWRRPRYLFLFVWWLVMLLPSILAPDPIPHSLRAIGTLPVACILSARALSGLLLGLVRRLQQRWGRLSLAVLVVIPLWAGWAGYNTWHSYFGVWRSREEVYYAYHGQMADLAARINRDRDPEAVYLFPVNYDRRGEAYRENTVEALHKGPVPVRYIVVDDQTVASDLTDICRGRRRVHLIVWTHGEHIDADPRQVLPFLLETFGRATEATAHSGYRLFTYELPGETVEFRMPLDFAGTSAEFDDGLRLVAQARGTEAESGGPAWLALRWRVQQAVARDYKASLRLTDAQGHLVGQADTWLYSNEHQSTSQWEPGQTVTTYHLLSSLPATMPGQYQVSLLLYDPVDQHQARVVDPGGIVYDPTVSLGPLQITRPWRSDSVEPAVELEAVQLAPGLALMGYDMDQRSVNPGGAVHVALYWQALDKIAQDYRIVLQLADEDGNVAATLAAEPTYPTSAWQTGDQWRDWHRISVPAETASGAYTLSVRLAGAEANTAWLALDQVQVQGRARLFEPPPVDHPLAISVGEAFRLVGYELAEDVISTGKDLRLTLYWQAGAETDTSYTVFTHLLDANSRIWGQKDSVPGEGAAPTTGWLRGEVIVDKYRIEVDDDAPVGEYVIEIGMYEPTTGQRLPVFDEAGAPLGDRILLDTKVLISR